MKLFKNLNLLEFNNLMIGYKKIDIKSKDIFYEILNSNLNYKLELTYFFDLNNKIFINSNNKNLILAEKYLNIYSDTKLEDLNLNMLVNIIIAPAIAYYYYIKNEFDISIEFLLKSIECIYKKKDEFTIKSIFDQYFNICRVLFKKNEIDLALIEINYLLEFLISGNNFKGKFYLIGYRNDLVNIGEKVYNNLNFFYINTAILKTIFNQNIDINKFNRIFYNFENIQPVFKNTFTDYLLKTIQFIKDAENKNLTKLEMNVNELILELHNMPNALQYVFLKQLEKLIPNNIELKEFIPKYAIEKLELGFLFEKENNN